jgi:hypothetical protein
MRRKLLVLRRDHGERHLGRDLAQRKPVVSQYEPRLAREPRPDLAFEHERAGDRGHPAQHEHGNAGRHQKPEGELRNERDGAAPGAPDAHAP